MVQELYYRQMEENIKGNGLMTRDMVKEHLYQLMVTNYKENGFMINFKFKEINDNNFYIKMSIILKKLQLKNF